MTQTHFSYQALEAFSIKARSCRTALILVTHNEKLANRLAKKRYMVEGRLES